MFVYNLIIRIISLFQSKVKFQFLTNENARVVRQNSIRLMQSELAEEYQSNCKELRALISKKRTSFLFAFQLHI